MPDIDDDPERAARYATIRSELMELRSGLGLRDHTKLLRVSSVLRQALEAASGTHFDSQTHFVEESVSFIKRVLGDLPNQQEAKAGLVNFNLDTEVGLALDELGERQSALATALGIGVRTVRRRGDAALDSLARSLSTRATPPSTPIGVPSPKIIPPADLREAILRLLTQCTRVTAIDPMRGFADLLAESLIRRRLLDHTPEFWQRLDIIYPSAAVSTFKSDDLNALHTDRTLAANARNTRLNDERHSLAALLLRSGAPRNWRIFAYDAIPAIRGCAFELPSGKVVILVLVTTPKHDDSSAQGLMFEDSPDRAFLSLVDSHREASMEDHELVISGIPSGGRFYCSGARFRRSVMMNAGPTDVWLATILLITVRDEGDRPAPLLQLNVPRNSTREIGKLSHVSGYVNEADLPLGTQSSGHVALDPLATMQAAKRELQDVLSVEADVEVQPLGDIPFHYANNESLWFHIFTARVPPQLTFTRSSHMRSWTVDDLLRVRKFQVLRNLVLFLSNDALSNMQMKIGAEVLQSNLRLHGELTLASEISRHVKSRKASRNELIAQLQRRLRTLTVKRSVDSHDFLVEGIAGLQYREFFSTLLPTYAAVGVVGADEVISALEREGHSSARDELVEHYHNREAMQELMIEL